MQGFDSVNLVFLVAESSVPMSLPPLSNFYRTTALTMLLRIMYWTSKVCMWFTGKRWSSTHLKSWEIEPVILNDLKFNCLQITISTDQTHFFLKLHVLRVEFCLWAQTREWSQWLCASNGLLLEKQLTAIWNKRMKKKHHQRSGRHKHNRGTQLTA